MVLKWAIGIVLQNDVQGFLLFFDVLHEGRCAKADDAAIPDVPRAGALGFYQFVVDIHLEADLGVLLEDVNLCTLGRGVEVEAVVLVAKSNRNNVWLVVHTHGNPASLRPLDNGFDCGSVSSHLTAHFTFPYVFSLRV